MTDSVEEILERTRTREITVSILEETYQQGEELIQENGWGDEGWRIILAHGIGSLRSRDRFMAMEDRARLIHQLAELESMYAVMKFRAYMLTKDNQTLTFNVNGLRAQVDTSSIVLESQRREIAALKAEIAALQQEVARLRANQT